MLGIITRPLVYEALALTAFAAVVVLFVQQIVPLIAN
jgi:hypothetical protein